MLRYSEDGKARDRFRAIYESPRWLFPYEHRDEIRFPFILSVEPTNNCNADCLYCSRQMMRRPRGYMALETMERLCREAAAQPGPVAVRFGGMGEPLLHQKFVELVTIAKSHGLLTLSFTNGRFLTDEKMQHDRVHILKALMFFKDAAEQAMPDMLVPLEWTEVTQFFVSQVPRLSRLS